MTAEEDIFKSEYAEEILANLRAENPAMMPGRRPAWLGDARWRPELFFRIKGDRRVLAVDIVPSGALPHSQFRKEVKKLLDEHSTLRVVVCILDSGLRDNPETEEFCRKLGIGLKVLSPGIGIETLIRTDLDGVVVKRAIPAERGWFPKAICEQAIGLKKLIFHKEIDSFVSRVGTLGDDEQRVRKLALTTIDTLLRRHPSFDDNFGRFMRLDRFERLLKLAGIMSSDHVFHSLRVFIAGCPVINQFYDTFEEAHRRYCVGNAKMCVEYSWLLTAIFHDVGRPAEGARELLLGQLEDEYAEVAVHGRPERWREDKYQSALRVMGSFAAFVARGDKDDTWDGGVVDDEYGKNVYVDWINIFDAFESHGVISAIEFLADIVEKQKAADQMHYRPFVFTHAVPAALAILLHDWHIWKAHAKKWGLYPVNQTTLPLAALLIYLDTWDDYKRRIDGPEIQVQQYCVDEAGAHVVIRWGDSEWLKKERVKYREFSKALNKRTFELKIDAEMIDVV